MDSGPIEHVYSLYLLNEDLPNAETDPKSFIHNFIISPEYLEGLSICCKRFVFVELKKFNSFQRVFNRLADLWLKFLTFVDAQRNVIVPDELYSDLEIGSALKCLRDMHLNEKEYRSYDKYWDNVSYERSISSGSDFAVSINLFYFMAKVIGDKKKAYNIAIKMLDKDMEIGLIMDLTDLTKEEIASIERMRDNQ